MGWASYYEDIQERLDDNLRRVRKSLTTTRKAIKKEQFQKIKPQELKQQFNQLNDVYRQCRKLKKDIDYFAELVTDPKLNLVYELTELQKQNGLVEGKLAELDENFTSLTSELRQELQQRDDLADTRVQLTELRHQNAQLEDNLAKRTFEVQEERKQRWAVEAELEKLKREIKENPGKLLQASRSEQVGLPKQTDIDHNSHKTQRDAVIQEEDENFADLLETYTTPQDINRHKPDEVR